MTVTTLTNGQQLLLNRIGCESLIFLPTHVFIPHTENRLCNQKQTNSVNHCLTNIILSQENDNDIPDHLQHNQWRTMSLYTFQYI